MSEKSDFLPCDCGIAEMSPKDWIGVDDSTNPHAKSCPAYERWRKPNRRGSSLPLPWDFGISHVRGY